MAFAAERLREIRLLQGYTLDNVAKEIGVSKQAVSKYEAGKAIPATDTLKRILDFFDVKQSYLTNQREFPDEHSLAFYRALRRTPLKTKELAEVYLKWFYEIITVIDEIYPLRMHDLPQIPGNLSIQEKAELLREAWNLGEEAVGDMAWLLERHGFFLFTVDWQDSKIDGFSQMIGSRPIIVLNSKKGTKQRQRFSIAHELGHIILHRNQEEMTDEMEKEADEFAGCFLMPERMIRVDLIRRNADYMVELSKKWGVSPQAVVERCVRLKLLGRDEEENEARRSGLYQRLNRIKMEESISTICSIRAALDFIQSDESAARRFLKELCFPVRELQKLCGLTDELSQYDRLDNEDNINDIEGTQMSFLFHD